MIADLQGSGGYKEEGNTREGGIQGGKSGVA